MEIHIAHLVLDEFEETQPAFYTPDTYIRNRMFVCSICGRVWGKLFLFNESGKAPFWSATDSVCDRHKGDPESVALGGSLFQWQCRWNSRVSPWDQEFGPKAAMRELELSLDITTTLKEL